MKLFKYNQFINENPLNENLDKAKKMMKDAYILSTAAKELDLITPEIKYDMDSGSKRMVTPVDFTNLDSDKKKELVDKMRSISVSDDKMRQLITTPEFKAIRELTVNVGGKDYQLDRDSMGWLSSFVYFFYYENASLEDLKNVYTKLIENKDILQNLEINVNGRIVKKAFDLNFINNKISNNMELLVDGLNKLPNLRLYRKMEVDLPPHLKRDLKDSPQIIKDQFLEVAIGFDYLGTDTETGVRDDKKHDEYYKGFFGRVMVDTREGSKTQGKEVFQSPIIRYKNIRDFIEKARAYMKAIGNSSFESFYKKFQECNMKFGKMGAEEIFNENGIFVIEVKSYGANRILNAHTTHCIKDSLSQWDYYVNKNSRGEYTEENKQYYIYNFNLMQTDNMFTIGVTIDSNGDIRAAHNKIDSNVRSTLISTLKKWSKDYNIENEADKKASELGASSSNISRNGGLYSLMMPINGEELQRKMRSRAANMELVKKGISLEKIKELITVEGADVNRNNAEALDNAVEEDSMDKAKLLLELGASPNLKVQKDAPIRKAKSLDMIKLLVSYGSSIDGAVYENICHDLNAVKFCLDSGIDPNFDNSVALRRSCKGSYVSEKEPGESYLDAFKLSMDYGAKLEDSRGRSMVFKWAASYGRVDIIEYVVNMGAKHGFVGAYTWTAHSKKVEGDLLKQVGECLEKYAKMYEPEQWDVISDDKKWHLKL